jgi:hypothetical protein
LGDLHWANEEKVTELRAHYFPAKTENVIVQNKKLLVQKIMVLLKFVNVFDRCLLLY